MRPRRAAGTQESKPDRGFARVVPTRDFCRRGPGHLLFEKPSLRLGAETKNLANIDGCEVDLFLVAGQFI